MHMGMFCTHGGSPSMPSVGPIGSPRRMAEVSISTSGIWAMLAGAVR
jgi:hypothetical protein